MCTKNDLYIVAHSDLDLWPFDLRITPPFTGVRVIRSNIEWTKDMWQRDKYHKMERFCWWNVFDDMCSCWWSFSSRFDINRSIVDEDMREKRSLCFCSLWSLNLKFAALITLVQRYVFTKLEVSKTFLFRENRRHGTDGQTDKKTDEVKRLMRPLGDCIITHHR